MSLKSWQKYFGSLILVLLPCLVFTAISWAADDIITTVAGNGQQGFSGDGMAAISTKLNVPDSVAVDSSGNLYIADKHNQRIRKVDKTSGIITTVAGDGTQGFSGDGGPATSAQIFNPISIAFDKSDNLYIADFFNNRIRKVNASDGKISTVAGDGTYGFSGDGGPATIAQFAYPYGVAVDSSGNLFIADYNNHRIRKVNASDGKISTVAGNGTRDPNRSYGGFSGDGGPATSAQLAYPFGIAVDSIGNFYFVDSYNYRIRKVDKASGIITTVAGSGAVGDPGNDKGGFSGDGGPATSAQLNCYGVAVDSIGNLYIADTLNHRIRKVNVSDGKIVTLAGNTEGFSGDGGAAISAQLDVPYSVTVDSSGNLYIADFANCRIRKVTVAPACITQVQLDQKIAEAVSAATASMYTKTQLDAAVSTATASMYTKAQLDQAVKTEQLKWDANGDGRIGLEDIIRMLQVLAGLRP